MKLDNAVIAEILFAAEKGETIKSEAKSEAKSRLYHIHLCANAGWIICEQAGASEDPFVGLTVYGLTLKGHAVLSYLKEQIQADHWNGAHLHDQIFFHML